MRVETGEANVVQVYHYTTSYFAKPRASLLYFSFVLALKHTDHEHGAPFAAFLGSIATLESFACHALRAYVASFIVLWQARLRNHTVIRRSFGKHDRALLSFGFENPVDVEGERTERPSEVYSSDRNSYDGRNCILFRRLRQT